MHPYAHTFQDELKTPSVHLLQGGWQEEVPFLPPTLGLSGMSPLCEPRGLGLWMGLRCEPEQARPSFHQADMILRDPGP